MANPTKPGLPAEKPGRNAYREAFEQATRIASATETLERCAQVEAAVESLRVRYEQFFLGLTRRPPHDDQVLVRSAVLRLRQAFVRNTSARFRVQSLHNRFLSYERLWQRTCREIEEGTYHRDVYKARLRRRELPASAEDQRAAAEIAAFRSDLAANPLPTGDDDFAVDEDLPEETRAPAGMVARPVAASPSNAGRPGSAPPSNAAPSHAGTPGGGHAARSAPAGNGALQDEKLRAVYDAYIGARKRCSESTDGLSFESVSASLRRQVPELLSTHKATSVEFKVVIKGGKAVLKAVPR